MYSSSTATDALSKRGLRLSGEHLEHPPGLRMSLPVRQRFELGEDGNANLAEQERHQESSNTANEASR